MPLTLKEFRQKYPQYNKVSDQKLAEALHRKYYSNVPFDEFATKVDYKVKAEEPPPTIEEPAPPAEKSDRSWYEVSGERLIKGLGTQIAEGAKQGLGGVSQAAVDALPNSIDQLPPGLSYEDVYRLGGVREYYAQVYGITSNEQLKQIKAQATQKITARRKASEARTAEATPEDLTLIESGLRGSAESIARNLPGIAASIATGNPIPALASAGLQTGVESYGQARAEGVTPAKAARFGGIDGAIEIATSLLPTKWLLGAVGANSLSEVKKELLKFATGNMTGEQLATFGQSINAYANDLDQELAQAQTLGEKAAIQGRRQALTAIATLVSSGTFAGGVGAAAKITDITRERAESKRVADELSRSTAIRALDPNTYDPTLISPAQTVRPPEIVSGEPAAPPSRPRPFLTPEVGTALEGLTATNLPPEVIDGVPPAVVDSARDILTLVDEGKSINLFRARSLAKQLGVDLPNNANKETTLTALREAVALVAAPAPEVTSPKAAPAVEVAVDAPPVETARPKRVNPFLTPEALAQTEPVVAAPVATLTTPPAVSEMAAPVEFKVPSDFKYTLVESPNYDFEPLSLEDADFELEVLQGQAERGRLTPQNFASSEIGKRLDTVQIGAVNEGLKTDPVGTIKALREKLTPEALAQTEPVVAAPAAAPAPSKSGAFAFEPEKLEALRVPEYKSREKLIELPIDDFLAMAKPGRMEAKEAETSKLLKEGTKFSSIPFLWAYMGKDGALKVEGHEGRHRALALKEAGYETLPIILRTDIRWSEQTDPKKFDYQAEWPTAIVSEDGTKTIPMPVSRDQALVPYTATPITPPEALSEPVSTRAGEAVAGATAGSPALPVQRGVSAGREAAESGVSGVEPARGVAERVDEREEDVSPALELELKKIQGRDTIAVNKYNKYVQQYKVADETQRAKLRPIIEKLMLERRQILGQVQKIAQQKADVERRAQAQAKFEPMPVGTRIGMIGYESSDDSYWEKVGDNKWQRTLGGKTDAIFKTSAEIDGSRMLPPAPTTRIFKSIDILNRTAPDLAEQTSDRAPSLRVGLKKAKKDYDAGVLTGDQLAETTGDLLLKTQKERIVQPRKRGADYIRERLMNARRTGAISQEGIDLAEWFIRQNPLLVDDLGISIRGQPLTEIGTSGFYNPVGRIVTLFKGAGDSQTATHEILHHLERLMPANIRSGILKAYVKQLTKAAKNAKTDAEKAFFNAITNYHYLSGEANQKAEYEKALDVIRNKQVPASYYQYVNPSEFWAVNGARIVQGRYGIPPGIVGQLKRWLRDFLEKAKDLFGLKSDAAIIRALDSLAKADGKYQTDRMLVEAPAYKSVKPPKNLLQVRKAGAKAKKPSLLQRAAQQFEGHNFYKNLVRKFADTTEPIMALDRDKKRSGFLITLGPDRNDIASELVRSPNIADFIIRQRIEPAERRLQQYIKNYARVMGIKPEDAVDKLDSILIAIHEPVRRETKYLRNVGLRNDIRLPAANLPFAAGQPDMTPADYREYLEGLRSKVPPDQAAEIQDVMRVVVDKFKTSRGFSPKAIPGKPTPLDINDKFYDIIPRKIDGKDAYTPQLLQAELNEYRSLTGTQKTTVDDVRTALAEINELERQLSQEANYWPPQVDSIISSYQWGDTYVPFQGIPDADDSLDYSSKKLSGELTEATQAWDGRSTDFDSPILQSIYNAKRAAGRVSRKDLVSVTIVNNIKQGFLRAKSIDPKVYTFDNRRAPDFDFSVLQGREKVLDYQPNGDVHVYELKQDDKIDALKKAYKELHPWLEPVSTLTSWIAQYHTRFNPAFAPMDFFTNTFSNLGFITAGEGGVREGGRYLAQTLSNVARSGLFLKTANISRVLSAKNPAALNKLLQSNDSFYQDAMDFISRGGLSLQRQALGIDVQREKLVNAVGPGLFIKTNEQAARLFDIYNDMFELTSRLAAYTAHLKDITARAKLKKIDVNIPEVQEALKREATTFALELMNFSKMGEYGRTLSAVYMFFKPGATSAKLAYDAVRKAIISADSALKNADPAVWARLNSVYELQELQEEQAKPRPDQQKITELQNAITANEEAKQKFINNYNMEKKNAAIAIPLFFAAGAIYYSIAQMFSPDDDEGRNKIATDEMSRWTRYARMPMPGQKEFFQLPWGYGVGAFAAAGAQTEALRQGNLSFSDYASNMIEIGLDSFMPFPASRTNPFDNVGAWIIGTIAPSAARGFLEYTLNLDSLGNPIYNSRLGKYADAYSGTARAGELHNAMADVLFGISEGNINWNPNTIAYMLNTYADGPNVIAESSFNIALRLRDEKDADLKKDIPVFKRFVGRMSNFDAQEFSEAERWIREKAPIYKTFRDIRPPEEYDRYVEKHPTVPVISAMYDNVLNGALSTLSEQRKLIQRNRELTPKERTEYLDDIDYNINATKRNFVESYRAIREEEDAGS